MGRREELYDLDASAPDDLPEIDQEKLKKLTTNPLNTARICKQCNKEADIVSNSSGVQAYCRPCKLDWPISGALGAALPMTLGRGVSKQTITQPDYQMAFDVEDPK